MAERVRAEVFPPGEYIRDELEARGWTQEDLAQILLRPAVAVSQIINGKRGITPETAKALGAAFGTSAEMWMNLENSYQLSKIHTDENAVANRAKLYSIAPVNEMLRRGWIAPGDTSDLQKQLLHFFGTDDVDRIPPLSFAARMSASYEAPSTAHRAWAYRALRLARTVEASVFDAAKFRQQLMLFRTYTQHVDNLRQLPRVLSNMGIRLVIVAHLERTKLDGATLWLDGKYPVVALTLRFDRIDHFWFTLIHELVHVANGDCSIDSDLLSDSKGNGGAESSEEMERMANAQAASILVPADKLESFVIRTSPLYSRDKVLRFAQANSLHPGVVLGQLHHRHSVKGDGVPQKNLRDLLVPVRQVIVGQTITDGFGHQPGAF